MPTLSKSVFIFGFVTSLIAATQPLALIVLGEPNTSSLSSLSTNPALSQLIFRIMFAYIPAMFISYFIVALSSLKQFPFSSSIALFAFALWFSLELIPRSVDLWVVQERWLPAYGAADSVLRLNLENQYRLYRDGLHALVFVRRHALLLGQLTLAFVIIRQRPWGLLLALSLGLSITRLTLGSLASYGPWPTLAVVADPLYFITSGLVFPLLAIWHYVQSKPSPPAT